MKNQTTSCRSTIGPKPFTGLLHVVIDGTDTSMGKVFDFEMLIAILTSVAVVMLDSVLLFHMKFEKEFYYMEWFFTILFTIEYLLRLYAAPNRLRYMFSFYGIVDFLSIIPTYVSFFIVGVQPLLVVRFLRILMYFPFCVWQIICSRPVFLAMALRSSKQKIIVFFVTVAVLVTIFGSVVYVVEGAENGYTSIPVSIYWAIVTMTTVGYGDISPKTPLGQAIASLVMIMGYSIIAVPTGLFTAELYSSCPQLQPDEQPNCGKFAYAQ